jgi:hypothetical protein
VVTALTFLVTAVTIAVIAQRTMPDALTNTVWLTLLVGDGGYACLAISLTNVLILFGTQRPWVVVREFTTALGINLFAGYVLSHGFDRFHAVDGLLISALFRDQVDARRPQRGMPITRTRWGNHERAGGRHRHRGGICSRSVLVAIPRWCWGALHVDARAARRLSAPV